MSMQIPWRAVDSHAQALEWSVRASTQQRLEARCRHEQQFTRGAAEPSADRTSHHILITSKYLRQSLMEVLCA